MPNKYMGSGLDSFVWQAEQGLGDAFRLLNEMADCQACPLRRGRHKVVPGQWSARPSDSLVRTVMFIGEAPGEQEDQEGMPFVGRGGQLLRRMIKFFGFESFYITNVVKCRPPDNRNPTAQEIQACNLFLKRQIKLVRPKIICAVGKFAAQTLLGTDRPITELRGRVYAFTLPDGTAIPLVPTFHPAYALRNPKQTGKILLDFQTIHAMEVQYVQR